RLEGAAGAAAPPVDAAAPPRGVKPARCLPALGRVPLGAPIVRPGPAEEPGRAVERELRVCHVPLAVVEPWPRLAEPERLTQPVDGRPDVLVRDHRDGAIQLKRSPSGLAPPAATRAS